MNISSAAIPVQNKLKFRIKFLLLTKAHNFSCAVSNLYSPNRFNGLHYFYFLFKCNQ